jgi:hypothetical protein
VHSQDCRQGMVPDDHFQKCKAPNLVFLVKAACRLSRMRGSLGSYPGAHVIMTFIKGPFPSGSPVHHPKDPPRLPARLHQHAVNRAV